MKTHNVWGTFIILLPRLKKKTVMKNFFLEINFGLKKFSWNNYFLHDKESNADSKKKKNWLFSIIALVKAQKNLQSKELLCSNAWLKHRAAEEKRWQGNFYGSLSDKSKAFKLFRHIWPFNFNSTEYLSKLLKNAKN